MGTKLTPEELLKSNHYCVFSTANSRAEPWSTPLFYAFDEHWRLFWISASSGRHSQNLAENPKASAVIYEPPGVSHEVSALYLSGMVSICQGEQLSYALGIYMKRTELGVSGRVEDYQENSPCRIFCLDTDEAFTLHEPEWEDNLLLDKRVAVEIP
ncbi:pyridoxamine 5'-phosphate oxidase family protein [Parendozoicomonas sp. Alg238-R29]|uniref:pyridoxamine 5'-phosphate oxidase family protein n=1 Tax=Parendozoicomonas sp. Alg238-R29 TaxID=2993446 RepID=UPI00248EBD71|nr:pyridoxamine 5'-phosphate oxidase family protein [Parendozoicomonas sp. Alg238-R29]